MSLFGYSSSRLTKNVYLEQEDLIVSDSQANKIVTLSGVTDKTTVHGLLEVQGDATLGNAVINSLTVNSNLVVNGEQTIFKKHNYNSNKKKRKKIQSVRCTLYTVNPRNIW